MCDRPLKCNLKASRESFRWVYKEYVCDIEKVGGIGIEQYNVCAKLLDAVRYAYRYKGPHLTLEQGASLRRYWPVGVARNTPEKARERIEATREARQHYHVQMRARLQH